jgi:hypothetical protein
MKIENSFTALLFRKAWGICNAESIWKKIIIKFEHKCLSPGFFGVLSLRKGQTFIQAG